MTNKKIGDLTAASVVTDNMDFETDINKTIANRVSASQIEGYVNGGKVGGKTVYGGSGPGENLTLESTSSIVASGRVQIANGDNFKVSVAAPHPVVAAVGIAPIENVLTPILSSTAGHTDITAVPQIAAGIDGQLLILIGTDSVRTVTLHHGDGVSLNNGVSFTFGEDSLMELVFYNSVYNERCRKA